jgi:chromate transporter
VNDSPGREVVQFDGFMGAYRNPGALEPLLAGVLGSIVTTWVTFARASCGFFLALPILNGCAATRH